MYSEKVLDHVARPRNVGPLSTTTHCGTAGEPGEGPYVILEFRVVEGVIAEAAYQTYGCFAAIGAASITAQVLTGRTIEQVHTDLRRGLLTAHDIITLLGGLPEGKESAAVLTERALWKALGSVDQTAQ